MSHVILGIRSNALTVSDVVISDTGHIIPAAGGFVDFSDHKDTVRLLQSVDLRLLASDNAYPAAAPGNTNTLILTDGTNDIPSADVDNFLGGLELVRREQCFSTIAPTINDDEDIGYAACNLWVDVSEPALYICQDASPGAAIWVKIASLDGSGTIPYTQIPLELRAKLHTGLLKGGEITINGGDPTKFDIAAGLGMVVNVHSDPAVPVITLLSWAAFTAETPVGIGSTLLSYIGLDSGTLVVQQTTPFTSVQLRNIVSLGLVFHPSPAGIVLTGARAVTIFNSELNAIDFVRAFGPLNVSGNEFGPNGVNLRMDKTAGEIYSFGSNYDIDKASPSVLSTPGTTPVIVTSGCDI